MSSDSITDSQRRYTLIILTIIYAFNFLDRQILVILQEPIKADMGLSDAQLGILTGLAFAVFYVTAGIPIAYWADRGNRRNIIALALTIWSAMTAFTGLVQNYVQMVIARIGVGVGEAGGSPPSHAMISDLYPEKQRATAMAIFSTGTGIGTLLGFLVGGILIQFVDWRTIFLIVGLPGIAIAVVLRFTVKEPTRGRLEETAPPKASLQETLRLLRDRPTFWIMSFGFALSMFTTYGAGNFIPSYLIRSHEMTVTQVGISLALIAGFSGMIGIYLGGVITDRMILRDKRWYLWTPALAMVIAGPFAVTLYLSDNTPLALICLFIGNMLNSTAIGPAIAVAHGVVPPSMRALVSSILFFIMNLIGMGIGPVYTGWISDLLEPRFGDDSLRYAMLSVLLITSLSVVLLYVASRYLRRDFARQSGQ